MIFHATLGILDYFNVYNQDKPIFEDIPTYTLEASLAISLFCALSLILVIPICYVQLTNLMQNTTTHKRFGFKGDPEDLDGITDRKSMLLRDSGEWVPEMSNKDTYVRSEDEEIFKRHCCKKKIFDSHVLINETHLEV